MRPCTPSTRSPSASIGSGTTSMPSRVAIAGHRLVRKRFDAEALAGRHERDQRGGKRLAAVAVKQQPIGIGVPWPRARKEATARRAAGVPGSNHRVHRRRDDGGPPRHRCNRRGEHGGLVGQQRHVGGEVDPCADPRREGSHRWAAPFSRTCRGQLRRRPVLVAPAPRRRAVAVEVAMRRRSANSRCVGSRSPGVRRPAAISCLHPVGEGLEISHIAPSAMI